MACSDIEKPADLQGAAQSRPEGDGTAKGKVRMGLVKMNSIKMLTAKAQEVMDGPDPTSKYSFAEGMRREKAEEGLWKEYCSYGLGEALTPATLEKLLVKRAYDQRKANFHQNSLLNLQVGEMAKPVFDNSTKHNGQDRDFARQMVKIVFADTGKTELNFQGFLDFQMLLGENAMAFAKDPLQMSDKVKVLEAEIREQKANGTYTPPSITKRGSVKLLRSKSTTRSRSFSAGAIDRRGKGVSITPGPGEGGENVPGSNYSTPTGAASRTPRKLWSTSDIPPHGSESTLSMPRSEKSDAAHAMGHGSPEKDNLSARGGADITSSRSLPIPRSLSTPAPLSEGAFGISNVWKRKGSATTPPPSAVGGKPRSIFTRIAAFLGFM